MADEPMDIQGRIGTLMDRIEDDFLRTAIGELFTMEKLKYGWADIVCKSCGKLHKYRAEVSSPDWKGIAYAVKTLLDATGRTKEPPKPEDHSETIKAAVREVLLELSTEQLERVGAA